MSTRPTATTAPSRKRSALATLGPVELADVLGELLRARPELRAEAERIAREQLAGADLEGVAEQVEWELRSLSSDELNGRAGRQRWGYVEPTEAAWELLGETVAAHDREVERLIELDMIAAGLDTALGVIAGLYRCRGCAHQSQAANKHMIARRGQRKADGEPARSVVDHVGDPDGCQKVIASLMDEYELYMESEHAICPACPVVRTRPVIVRSMLEWKGIHRDGRLGHWTVGDIRA